MNPAIAYDIAHTGLPWTQPRGIRARPTRTPVNDNWAGGGHCPACNAPAAVAPIRSEYHGQGLIHHHWACGTCGHGWVTALRVSA
jgi:hypothetical protein